MKSENKILIYITIFLSVIIIACSGPSHIQSLKNVSSIYNPSKSTIHPEFMMYHISDSVSNLFFNINTKELHYNTANSKNIQAAKVQIHYRVYGSFTEKSYFDSSSVVFNIYPFSGTNWFNSIIPIKLPAGGNYSIELSTTDLLNQSVNLSYLFVDKNDISGMQNFLITDSNRKPVFNKFSSTIDSIRVGNVRANSDVLYIGFIAHDTSLPKPPFSLSREKEKIIDVDSTWIWEYGDNDFLNTEKEGIYLFSIDSNFTKGVTFFSMSDYYPETKTSLSVLEPIQYLQTSREYKKLLKMNNNKMAVDSFWLALSGNINRSKELIRVYYSRIYFANKYFSSYKEGWKTDRGMIYTVFGPPRTIYISETSERWIYGNSNNLNSMDFYFNKQDHPLCDNNFVLNRQEVYKRSWYQAVDTWRNGRVYSVLK